ncbi:protein LAZY 1 isoform X2 [Magnolia sinica]|uniref:protein LAZY 1 isoform X2 n=1 Tax=Magnolia sinica TaxID=86752 RepID=UPI002658AEA6|nr:protein LAZY 1 isoform X2 [Magnolia sinica]
MKLLGWMHRKFRQNGGEPMKDFVIGRPSLDEQHYLPKTAHYGRPSRSQKDNLFRNSFAGLDEAGRDEEHEDLENDELFHGLLAIGTLGSDPIDRISVETITEKQQTDDVTPNDIKLINDELEKELAKDETACDVSSARNSHVSAIMAVNGKQMDVAGDTAIGPVCPLQDYLFGSPIELPETTVVAAKKEHRTSLGELFMRSRMAEENGGKGVSGKCDEKRDGGDKSGVHRVKKMLKRRTTMPGATSRNSAGAGMAPDTVTAETKLHKILHIFHRKVHPESSAATKKCSKSEGYAMKDDIRYDGGGDDGGNKQLPDYDTIVIPQRVIGKDGVRRRNSHSNPSALALSDSNGNREYWIKTDAEYLVLEL